MKVRIISFLLYAFPILSIAQVDDSLSVSDFWSTARPGDSVLVVTEVNVFTHKCSYEISRKYGLTIEAAPFRNYRMLAYNQDSLQAHNKRVSGLYEDVLGKNWVHRILEEINVCEQTQCNIDSLKLYTGRPGGIMLTPFSDTITEMQACIILATSLWMFERYSKFEIIICSYALPGEEEQARSRGNVIRNLLISHGISENRVEIETFNSVFPANVTDPSDPSNCRMIFKVVNH